MPVSPWKLAPTAVIIAVTGVCIWPYTGSEQAATAPKAASLEFDVTLLAPEVGKRFERDPFHDETLPRPVVAASKSDSPKLDPGSSAGEAGVASRAGGLDDPRVGLVLNATYIQEGRGVALINGQHYEAGDLLDVPKPGVDGRVVAEIRPFAVLIKQGGRCVELGYPMPNSGVGAFGPVSMVGGRAGSPPPPKRPARAAKKAARPAPQPKPQQRPQQQRPRSR